MKKISIFSICVLCLPLIIIGCGKQKETNSENDIVDVSTKIPAENNTEIPINEFDKENDLLWADEHPVEGTTRSYLTNMWVTNEVEAIRPVAIMFPTDQVAQPQYNIGQAGILYEIMAEGGISRMMGIIQNWHTLDKIGNIRSAREYFVYLAKEWNPLVVHHGNIWYADESLASVDNIDGTSGNASIAFFRTADKEAPHNSFVSGSGLLKFIDNAEYSLVQTTPGYDNHFIFTTMAHPNMLDDYSDTVDATFIDMSPSFSVNSPYFEYNEEDGLYYRFMYGKKHIDAATDEQLCFKNIIVQNAYWEEKPDGKYLAFLIHDTTRDGWFFTNGKGIHITWKKESDESPTKYYDDNGAEIVLNTGKTMIFIKQEEKEFLFK